MDIEKRIRALEHRESIKELRYEYGRCIDHKQWDDFVDLFTPDARCSYEGVGTFKGHDELRELANDFIDENFVYSSHMFHHPILDIGDETATGTWMLDAVMAYPDGRIEWRQGRYEDSYQLISNEWQFEAITLESEAQGFRNYELIEHDAYGQIPRIE